MKACAVLGNGPGLKPENIPPGVFLVGVNRSYEVAWSPIICSGDGLAASRALAVSGALAVFATRGCVSLPVRKHSLAYFDAPEWAGNSGAFGIWIASRLGFDTIHLVGFGGDGHFDGSDGHEFKRASYRPNVEAAIEFAELRGAEVIRVGEEVMA